MSASQSHTYKLTYFDGVRGRAEMTRMMFNLANVEYENEKINAMTDWMGMKESTPLGSLPILTTEQGQIVQCTSIAYLVAGRLGFLPETDWEKAVCNSILVSINEAAVALADPLVMAKVYKMKNITEEEETAARGKAQQAINKTYNYIEQLAKKGGKYLFGDKITVADLSLYNNLEYNCLIFPETATHSDWLKNWKANMESDPKFAAYLSKRDPSTFGT